MRKALTMLSTLATEALRYFHRIDREAPGIGKVLATNDPPEWVRDLCMNAHDSAKMMPDDWRYEFIGDALDCLEEIADQHDDLDSFRAAFDEWFDGRYIYTNQQVQWLASRTDRYGYVDEAREYFDGMGSFDSVLKEIAAGMLFEAREVFESVLESLLEQAEAREEATAETEE